MVKVNTSLLSDRKNKLWFKSKERSEFQIKGPLTKEKVSQLSTFKKEPEWLKIFRLSGFELFEKSHFPSFGPKLNWLDLENMIYYSKPFEKIEKWEEMPVDIRETFEKLGVSDKMKKVSGLGLQYDSEIIFEKAKEMLEEKGIVYMSMDEAIMKYPELVKKYMGTVVSSNDNKFSALNSAIWSGGTFIYVPKNVKVPFPLHTYFRINMEGFGQFERTLIIADEGSEVTYVEGCTAPLHSKSTLHAAVVEIVALKNSKVKYITLQNWSKNVFNIGTKRAFAKENSFVQWIDGNFGSGVTMKYPGIYLQGKKARGEIISIAFVSSNQNIDSGARMIHLAPETTSNIISKTVSSENGISTFRGTLKIFEGADNATAKIKCDSLLLNESIANTIPNILIHNKSASVNHEAKTSNIDDETLMYLMSRGVDRISAESMIAFGFVREFVKELPMEYALELQRLIDIDMGGHENAKI